MNQILTMSRKVRRDVRGVTAIEYGLLVALIIIACIAALSLTGTNAKKVFVDLGNAISATFTPVDAFGSFVAVQSSQYLGDCSSISGRTDSGFLDSSGDFLSLDTCTSSGTQTQTYNNLNTATALDISSTSDGAITVPGTNGPGTGFDLANSGDVFVKLFKQSSGSGYSFRIYHPKGSLSLASIQSATAACVAEGGTLSSGSGSFTYCNGGKLYSNNLASQLIPSSAQ